jgi:hypothetical protein
VVVNGPWDRDCLGQISSRYALFTDDSLTSSTARASASARFAALFKSCPICLPIVLNGCFNERAQQSAEGRPFAVLCHLTEISDRVCIEIDELAADFAPGGFHGCTPRILSCHWYTVVWVTMWRKRACIVVVI